MTEGRYRLIGSTASPYAIKLRALMRYRRIPFDWLIMTKALRAQTAHLRPMLIPVLQYPDGSYRGETTALAYDLEARHQGRSVIPEDKAVAFVCDLLEDLADEWAVKPLFLFRWWDPEDQAYVSRWAGEEWSTSEAETGSAQEIEEFRQRQISRMVILGATEENKPLLEESYRRMLRGIRAACRHEQISVRQPAVARRLRLVRPAQRDGDRPDADADHARARAVHRSLGAAARRCLRRRGRMVSARAGARRHGGSAAENRRRALSAVPGRQRSRRLRKASSGWRSMSGACLTRWRRSNTRSNACSSCARNLPRWMRRDRAALKPVLERTGCWQHLS